MALWDWPFRMMGRVGRAIEVSPLSKGFFIPEQLLSRAPQGKNLVDFTITNQRTMRNTAELFKRRVDKIITRHGLNNETLVDQMLQLVEFPFYEGRVPTTAELSAFPRPVVAAARDHLKYVTDPIWRIAKKYDPNIGYIPGYFTHFPIRGQRNVIAREISDLEKTIADVSRSGDPAALNSISSLQAALSHLRGSLAKVEAIDASIALQRRKALDATLAVQRFGIRPVGGYFGPLSEARLAHKNWGYSTDYKDVMHGYIDGAFRKIFLDKWSRPANAMARSIENNAVRQYAYDYITAQRGALGAKTRLFLNESMRQLAPAAEHEAAGKWLSRAVDFATRFQYLTKIGLSWFRFPLVNLTQPTLTTYPLVGERIFVAALSDVFKPSTWEIARRHGVVFEPTLRRAVTEFLGRGGRLGQVERYLTKPAEFSEKVNRVWSFAAGLRQGKEMGMRPHEAIRHALNLVNRTQFLYHPEAMPLWSRNPVGRLMMQFRTFTSNYINYLSQVFRTGTTEQKMRAMGALAVLSGSSAFPLWDEVREGILRRMGVDIGELNPIEFSTEQLGLQPGINIGTSLEPWNFPFTGYNLLGPTIGPLTELSFQIRREPERAGEFVQRFGERLAPPVYAMFRGIFEREARARPTKTQPRGRLIGERPMLEMMFLRPSLESQRRDYIRLIGSAIVARRHDLVRRYIERMQEVGLHFGPEDMSQARRFATEYMKRRGSR